MPEGLERYPKYLIRFSAVYAFSSEEEAGGSEYKISNPAAAELQPSCTWIWADSPHAAGYESWAPTRMRGGSGPIAHYMVFGIDNNIGVVTGNAPSIEKLDGPTTLDLKF